MPITAWIHAIARYTLMDWLRERVSERQERDEWSDDVVPACDGHRAWEARHDVQRLLTALPEKQRLAILHARIWGSSVREAAQRMGICESDVKVSVHRGLRALSRAVPGAPHAA